MEKVQTCVLVPWHDEFIECNVTSCCDTGPITNEKCCPECGREIEIREEYVQDEIWLTQKLFDLKSVLAFQKKNSVQLITGEDFLSQCYINGKVYSSQLTPMFALIMGIGAFKKQVKYE